MTLLRVFAICVMLLAVAGGASAQLLGDNIHGALLLGGNNYFDPALGLVPPDANPLQPNAVVSDADTDYVEFSLWVLDGVTGLGYGIFVDVDDNVISIEFRSQVGTGWNPMTIVLSDLGDGTNLVGSFVGENDTPATMSHDATSITVDIPGGWSTASGTSNWMVIGLEGAVATDDVSIGSLKAQYR